MNEPVKQSRLFRELSAVHPDVQVWEDDEAEADGWAYCWIVARTGEEVRMLVRVRHRPGCIQRRGYDEEGEEVWTDAD